MNRDNIEKGIEINERIKRLERQKAFLEQSNKFSSTVVYVNEGDKIRDEVGITLDYFPFDIFKSIVLSKLSEEIIAQKELWESL